MQDVVIFQAVHQLIGCRCTKAVHASQDRQNQEPSNEVLNRAVCYCHLSDFCVVLILVLNQDRGTLPYLASEVIGWNFVASGKKIREGHRLVGSSFKSADTCEHGTGDLEGQVYEE